MSFKLIGPALEKAELAVTEHQKQEAIASGAASRASERLRATQKALRSLETQYSDVTKQLADKQKAAEAAAGTEFQTLEEAAHKAQEDLSEAQANLAVSYYLVFLGL